MTQNETSSPQVDLTGQQSQESQPGSVEPEKSSVLPEDSNNWQHALQKKQELIQAKEKELEEIRALLKEKEAAEKQKRLAEMSEAERYREVAEEEARRRGELELKFVVAEALVGKKLPSAIEELIRETPWAIPAVKRELGEDFTWDEAVEAVREHLPAYIESLVVSDSNPTLEEQPRKVDSERSIGDAGFTTGHIYTQAEVAEISKDPKEWEKHREAVLKQMQKMGGVLPQN